MMERLNEIVTKVDDFVWGPVMLILLVGTGIFLTIRTKFLPWRNLGYALKSTLSKEARTKSRGEGDVSPFSALTTALAATIGNRKYCWRCHCYGFRRGLALWCGCGFQLLLALRPSLVNVCWQLNTAK